jgi:hypothetical protein
MCVEIYAINKYNEIAGFKPEAFRSHWWKYKKTLEQGFLICLNTVTILTAESVPQCLGVSGLWRFVHDQSYD